MTALAAGTILVETTGLSPAEQWAQDYGQADAVADWSGTSTGLPATGPVDPADTAEQTADGVQPILTDDEATAALRAAFPDAESMTVVAHGPDAITDGDGHLQQVQVSDAPLSDPVLEGSLELTHGQAPERPGEAAVSDAILDATGAHVGDDIDLLLAGKVTVTGTVRDAADNDGDLVVTASPPPEHIAVGQRAYLTLPGDPDEASTARPLDPQALEAAGVQWAPFPGRYADGLDLGFGSRVGAGVGDLYALGGVALLMVAIVASAAFAVGARRQLRLLGVVAAAGGSPADLRRSVLLQGTVTGLLSSLVGLALAVVGTAAIHPLLDDALNRDVGGLAYPVVLLVLAVVLGTGAATAAAWLPARTAGAIPTLAALAGRRPQPPLPVAIPLAGLAAVAAGVATLGVWARESNRPWGVGLGAGVAVVLGATAIAPVLVGGCERVAGRLRRGGRLAARGLARQRLRSGAVVAAIMAPAGLTVLLACFLVTQEARDRQEWVDSQSSVGSDEVLYLQEGAGAATAERTVEEIGHIVPDAEAIPVLAALSTIGPPRTSYTGAVQVRGPDFIRYVMVASPEALAEGGADPAAVDKLAAGGVVLPARGTPAQSTTGPFVLDGAEADLAPDDIVFDRGLRLSHGESIALVSRATAERWQAEVAEIGTRFVNPQPLDDAQIRHLQRIDGMDQDAWLRQYLLTPTAQSPTYVGTIETPTLSTTYHDDSLRARLAALGASALLTLAVVAVALALTAAESSDEGRLLEAIGSPPSIRRSVSAWQATLLPAFALVVAVPIALTVAAVLLHESAEIGPDNVVVPWLTVAALAVGLPLLSGGVTWVGATFTGRRRRDLAAAVVGGD